VSGALYLVGVGPGDPELLTLKAVRVLREADVVAYPQTNTGATLARDIAAPYLSPAAVDLPVDLPISPDRRPAQRAYDAAARAIRTHVDAGRRVAWLCEGDPMLYGSAIYLLARLVDLPVEIVPGVSSVTAAAAAARRPLAEGNEVLRIVPATLPDAELGEHFSGAAGVVVLKPGRHFGRVRTHLDASGRAGDALLVEHATTPAQRVRPLRDVTDGEVPYFSLILSPAREPPP
jgi:precorrin-2/cobalt-factor-2 C20-methyltransferase